MNGKLLTDYIMYGILDGDAKVTNRTMAEIKSGEITHDKALPSELYDIVSQRVEYYLSELNSSLNDDLYAIKDYVEEQEKKEAQKQELENLIKKLAI